MPTDPCTLLNPCIPVEGVIATASRPYRDGNGRFLKHSPNGNPQRVQREARFLLAAHAQGAGPECYGFGRDWIVMEDLGTCEQPSDLITLYRAAVQLLGRLRAAHIRHNDLGPGNLILRDGTLYAVDYGRAQWLDEEPTPGCVADELAVMRAVSRMMEALHASTRGGAADRDADASGGTEPP